MRYISTLAAAVLTVGVILILGWTDAYHLLTASISCILLVPIVRLWKRRTKTTKRKKIRAQESLGHLLLRGLLSGAGVIGYLAVIFASLSLVALRKGCPDVGDRLEMARSIGAWSSAVEIVDTCLLQRSLSDQCEEELLRQRAYIVLDWASTLGPSEARAMLREALFLTEPHGLSAEAHMIDIALHRLNPIDLPPGSQVAIHQVDIDEWPDVHVYFRVEDRDGNGIANLAVEDVDAYENGDLLPVKHFSTRRQSSKALSVVLCIDVSGSMDSTFRDVQWAANSFLMNLSSRDFAEIIAFSDVPTLRSAWTRDKKYATAVIRDLETGGNTAIYDALMMALEDLKTQNGCKAVVLITDGNDTSSEEALERVLKEARVARVPVFAIGLESARLDRHRLKHIANETQGLYVEARSGSELEPVYLALARRFNDLYRLVYTSASDGFSEDTLRVVIGGENQVSLQTAYCRQKAESYALE